MGQASHPDYKRKNTYGEGTENERMEEKVTGRRKRRQKEDEDCKHERNNVFFWSRILPKIRCMQDEQWFVYNKLE
jgi:hypothetical protein